MRSRVSVSVSNFQVSASVFMTKSPSRSRLELWARSRSRRLRSRLHHWSICCNFWECFGFIKHVHLVLFNVRYDVAKVGNHYHRVPSACNHQAKIRKLGILAVNPYFCNAKIGDVKAQTPLLVTSKVHFINCQSSFINYLMQKVYSMLTHCLLWHFMECDDTSFPWLNVLVEPSPCSSPRSVLRNWCAARRCLVCHRITLYENMSIALH